jgi:hypothetical protein
MPEPVAANHFKIFRTSFAVSNPLENDKIIVVLDIYKVFNSFFYNQFFTTIFAFIISINNRRFERSNIQFLNHRNEIR